MGLATTDRETGIRCCSVIRDALQVREYLCGEGGNVHGVGETCFILVWDEQGNGSVAD